MEKSQLLNELKNNTAEELEFIYENQKDLYSEEEMQYIKRMISEKKKEEEQQLSARLPKEIKCQKCDGLNPSQNTVCKFCGCEIDKSRYYGQVTSEDDNEKSESCVFQYVASFLIPLVAFILGSLLLAKDDDDDKELGKTCIVLGIISTVIYALIYFLALR